MAREIHAELLLGQRVFGEKGEALGRIEEIIAEPKGSHLAVREYHLGSYAMMERLSATSFGRAFLEFFGAGKVGHSYRIPWNRLDLSDAERPKLLGAIDQLEKLDRS